MNFVCVMFDVILLPVAESRPQTSDGSLQEDQQSLYRKTHSLFTGRPTVPLQEDRAVPLQDDPQSLYRANRRPFTGRPTVSLQEDQQSLYRTNRSPFTGRPAVPLQEDLQSLYSPICSPFTGRTAVPLQEDPQSLYRPTRSLFTGRPAVSLQDDPQSLYRKTSSPFTGRPAVPLQDDPQSLYRKTSSPFTARPAVSLQPDLQSLYSMNHSPFTGRPAVPLQGEPSSVYRKTHSPFTGRPAVPLQDDQQSLYRTTRRPSGFMSPFLIPLRMCPLGSSCTSCHNWDTFKRLVPSPGLPMCFPLPCLEHCPEKPQDKKKKSSSLATLKRRFIKRRKASRSADHARHMRDLLSGWDVRDVAALVEEYEGTAALKELSMQACLARPEARTLPQDLASLYQHKYCTDVELIFQDTRFAAHRAVLAARCPFFRTLLSSSPGFSTQLLLDVGAAGIDASMFSALLRYLYTGELGGDDARLHNVDVLLRLSEEFGTPSSLETDMRELRQRMCYYDSVLCFSSDSEPDEAFGPDLSGEEEELKAHKAVLAARSPFFRNLLQRRVRGAEEESVPARIVLNESIIPRKYAGVVLHCMYTDAVELERVVRSPSTGSLGEAQALAAGKGSMSRAEEAMELYHIALFLEFSMLAQGCEDIVVESISLDSVVPILKWSSQPYGSKWVHRQALHFLCEEFSHVMTSDVLYELNKEYLLAAIQSDYLQRGVKRRDLDVEELKEILSPLLPCVRTEHILPTHSEVLSDTLKRGLISTPPSDMIPTVEGGKANAWLRQKSAGIYVRPRLFTSYVEEAKVQRAYALNCGEGATVSYELQIRVLREFSLPDGAAELLQNPHKFFPDERFGDESPVLALRPPARCRVNSTPAVESMFPDLQAAMSLHPPLPPPPPPYHPPTTQHIRSGWRPRVPTQQPSRSFSYPCNHSLLHTQASSKMASPIYPATGVKPIPPDCTNPPGRVLNPNKKGNMEPVINEFMPDIAMGVSAMSLKDRRLPEVTMEVESLDPRPLLSTVPPVSQCFSGRHLHTSSRKRHAAEPKSDAPQHTHFPDLYELYTHGRADAAHRLHLAMGAQANQRAAPKGETDLTCGLSPDTEPYDEWNRRVTGPGAASASTSTAAAGMSEDAIGGRERRSPNKHEYLYRKSAL
ncbi:BTB/POZ domain-containing protein 7 [Silurus asotus]|uniref:BTB/POZ domain-containing protein 7 n=1 Tax=Silurus asotus TaxID=30991 RepID=A0AAD5AFT7_SILAS|nr:BTB/POZ domain-containing protein 7 [Silurus asotus]